MPELPACRATPNMRGRMPGSRGSTAVDSITRKRPGFRWTANTPASRARRATGPGRTSRPIPPARRVMPTFTAALWAPTARGVTRRPSRSRKPARPSTTTARPSGSRGLTRRSSASSATGRRDTGSRDSPPAPTAIATRTGSLSAAARAAIRPALFALRQSITGRPAIRSWARTRRFPARSVTSRAPSRSVSRPRGARTVIATRTAASSAKTARPVTARPVSRRPPSTMPPERNFLSTDDTPKSPARPAIGGRRRKAPRPERSISEDCNPSARHAIGTFTGESSETCARNAIRRVPSEWKLSPIHDVPISSPKGTLRSLARNATGRNPPQTADSPEFRSPAHPVTATSTWGRWAPPARPAIPSRERSSRPTFSPMRVRGFP